MGCRKKIICLKITEKDPQKSLDNRKELKPQIIEKRIQESSYTSTLSQCSSKTQMRPRKIEMVQDISTRMMSELATNQITTLKKILQLP